jgi:hypothetical protein
MVNFMLGEIIWLPLEQKGLNLLNLNREGLHEKRAVTTWNMETISAFA